MLAAMPRHTWRGRDQDQPALTGPSAPRACGHLHPACPVPSSVPLTCVFPLPGAPMSSVTSPVYSPESSSWSRLRVQHRVGSPTHLQAERQGHREAAVPRVPFPNADMCLGLYSFPPTPKLSPRCGKQQICSVGDTQGQSQVEEELWSWEQGLNTQGFSA